MLDNLTPFAAELLPGHRPDGSACRTLVIKATLDFAGRPVAQGSALPIYRGDAFFEEDGLQGTVRHEADLAPFKPRVDVVFNGFAHAPGGACGRAVRRGPVHRRGNPHAAHPRPARVAPAHGAVPRGGGLRA
ncbi:DUF2169 domain-containing protein, partial [Paracidovorax cattleyae]|uniref:DUF2169 domain-containing protein n=1 Tax=Paracidovorax cattleyae TaxID=80868 RepID=UPI001E4E437C